MDNRILGLVVVVVIAIVGWFGYNAMSSLSETPTVSVTTTTP